jgi:DNA-binding response OmpR family regulator
MSRRLVFLIEDSQELAANLEIALRAIRESEIRVAMGAVQAMALLAEVRPGDSVVIVTDIQLPDTDGVELIERLREQERFRGTPIVAVSGEDDPAVRTRLRELGVDKFFRKPFSPLVLKSHLESLLDAQSPEENGDAAAGRPGHA